MKTAQLGAHLEDMVVTVVQRWWELVAASGSQESASSLTSVILSMDLRISATRFRVSAPDTSCLKQTDTRAITRAVQKQPARDLKERVPGRENVPQINQGLAHWTLCGCPQAHVRVHWPATLGLAVELRDSRYRWWAGSQTSSVETDSEFCSLPKPR